HFPYQGGQAEGARRDFERRGPAVARRAADRALDRRQLRAQHLVRPVRAGEDAEPRGRSAQCRGQPDVRAPRSEKPADGARDRARADDARRVRGLRATRQRGDRLAHSFRQPESGLSGRRMRFADLRRFFAPRSVAFVGATEDLGKFGGRCMRLLIDFGYESAIYPVNPKRAEIFGRKCYASIGDLPETPDHVGIVLPAAAVPAALEECARRSVPFATVFTSGFSETGTAEGISLQQRLVEIARSGGVRLMGPNCNGMISFVDRFALTSTAAIKGPRRAAGDIGIASQSGGAGQINVMWHAQQAGLGVSYQVSCGNNADLDLLDYMAFMVEDPNTRVVLAIAEHLDDGERLRALARRAAQLDKPVVMVKV